MNRRRPRRRRGALANYNWAIINAEREGRDGQGNIREIETPTQDFGGMILREAFKSIMRNAVPARGLEKIR